MAGKVAASRIPGQLICGAGAAETVGGEAKRLEATHAFILSDPNLQTLGVTDRIIASLSAQGIRTTVYTEIEFEPSVGSVVPAAAAAKASQCDLVIGLGGGSILDTAKAVAVLTRNAGQVEDYLGIGLVKRRGRSGPW
jgi:alcohol dehydrogenase class IV